METFARLESEVRSYMRAWPTVFTRATGHRIWDERGRAYIDFFCGAGALNYGHNPPALRARLVEYIEADGVMHSLDMATAAKREFLSTFDETVLRPRGLEYKVQFPGPTGTNAVEAALKLARKVSGRQTVIAFTNAFHGMTLGALAVTANPSKRRGAGLPLSHSVFLPYDGFLGEGVDTIEHVDALLRRCGDGADRPAAVIVETVQGEGGVNTARDGWLRRLADLCHRHDVLLIVDDIQAGCGRTGPFFSFEPSGILPDIVCLSKSISGYGLPMALTIFRQELDVWAPGEHNGTFRGNNAAFVTAAAALDTYWRGDDLPRAVKAAARTVQGVLTQIAARYPAARMAQRGRGLFQGLHCGVPGLADGIARVAFERGLLVETAGPQSDVVKVLPPLTIDAAGLAAGLGILEESVADAVRAAALPAPVAPAGAT